MKKLYKKWAILIYILLIIIIQLIDYYLNGDIHLMFPVVIVALFPTALKKLGYKVSKKIERVIGMFALIGMIYVIIMTFKS